MSALRFAIAGTGMIARYHAEAIARTPGAELVAVCRSAPAKAAEATTLFGVPCASSYDALVARADVDAVCICTPSGLHAEQTIIAARAGKHVLVEKPMALAPADAGAAIAACREAGVTLGVALQRRTDPRFRAIRDTIAGGGLGRMVLGTVSVPYFRPQEYYDSAAWRGTWALDGGGALMNQGIHLVDLLLWCLGDVQEVRAHATTLAHDIEVEDCVTASLVFASGALGTISATTAASPGYPHRIEVYGDQGGIQIEGETVVRAVSSRPGSEVIAGLVDDAGATSISAGAGASPTGISTEGHVRLVTDFVDAIRENRPPVVPGEEGRRALALVYAIYESVRTGRPVALSTF
jgi:predicted dehydrogenase